MPTTLSELKREREKRDGHREKLEAANRELARMIEELRESGTPWSKIETAMGVTRQALHRFLARDR